MSTSPVTNDSGMTQTRPLSAVDPMDTREERRRLRATSPSDEGLVRLGATLGGEVVAVEELFGGSSTSVHGLDVREPGGRVARYVLKRFIASDDAPPLEWERLHIARGADVPTPEPVLLDLNGEYFGMPALVMTRLPGTSTYTITELAAWSTGDILIERVAAFFDADMESCP